MRRIGGEQNMQQRCAAARQSDNEQGLADFLLGNSRVKFSVAREHETISQNAQHIAAQRHSADDIEARFTLAGFKQARKRLKKFAIAEIV